MRKYTLVFGAVIALLIGCVEMTPEERAAYERQRAEQWQRQQAERAEFCRTSNTCAGTAREVLSQCRERVEGRLNFERTNVYGETRKRYILSYIEGNYIDSRVPIYGSNGYFIISASTKTDTINSRGNIINVDIDSWEIHCVTRGDMPEILNIEYKIR